MTVAEAASALERAWLVERAHRRASAEASRLRRVAEHDLQAALEAARESPANMRGVPRDELRLAGRLGRLDITHPLASGSVWIHTALHVAGWSQEEIERLDLHGATSAYSEPTATDFARYRAQHRGL